MSSRSVSLALALAVTFLTLGCTPTLSTLAPARTVPQGHVQLTTGVDIVTTSGELADAIAAGADMDNDGPLSAEDVRRGATAASAALVQPSSVGYQVSAAYGISRQLEVGVRSSMNTLRGHGRFQFLRVAPGIYGSVGVGVSTYLYGLPLQTLTDGEIESRSFSRLELDVPLSFGYSNRWLHLWAGPKLIVARYDAEFAACVAESDTGNCRREATGTLDGTVTYFAGQAGIALGWRQVWLAAELTIAHVDASADLHIVSGTRSESLQFDKTGLAVAPTIGLITWF